MAHEHNLKSDGYHRLPGGWQSPTKPKPVNKELWQKCDQCGRLTPAVADWQPHDDGTITKTGTYTYVCAHCGHCHVGTPYWTEDSKAQDRCHNCGTGLGDAYQCPGCSYPRGWMRIQCPQCSVQQPVNAPHWVVHCDLFHLECVNCENTFDSLCIC